MSEVTVRPAALDDVDDIADLHVRAWRWAYRGLLPDELLDGLDPASRARMWRGVIADGSPPFVAVADARLVGFCHAGPSRDDDALPATGEVTSIYLDPEYVGRGAGRALWNAALDQLRGAGCGRVSVWVLDTNQRGRSFYERMGLTADGTSKDDDHGGFPVSEVRYEATIG